MRFETRFIFATAMSALAFVMTGGVRAAEQAVKAEEAKAAPSAPAETSIPFANMGGIRDWEAADNSSIYVQDNSRNWYLAKLSAPCVDLPFATTIGFETRGVNQLDRFGTVIVAGQRYPLTSFVASGPPPSRVKADTKAGANSGQGDPDKPAKP